MKYLLIFLLTGCTFKSYYDLKCGAYIGTYKTLSMPRYLSLDKPVIIQDLGGGDTLIFIRQGGNILQYLHTWDTVGAYKALTTPITKPCTCK